MIPEYLDVPIFPLPNVTFFPRTLLPLHVFEPRYRRMVSSILSGDRLMGVALLREGWQKDYFGRPPIHKTFGVGKVVEHEQLANGCYNIILNGLYRVRLVSEYPTSAFRTGRVMVMQDGPIDHKRAEAAELQKELAEDCRGLMDALPEYRNALQGLTAACPHPAMLVDLIASSVVIDPYDRQSILEDPDPLRRMQLTRVQLKRLLHELERNAIEEEVFEED